MENIGISPDTLHLYYSKESIMNFKSFVAVMVSSMLLLWETLLLVSAQWLYSNGPEWLLYKSNGDVSLGVPIILAYAILVFGSCFVAGNIYEMITKKD